jgi:hypothetical protein
MAGNDTGVIRVRAERWYFRNHRRSHFSAMSTGSNRNHMNDRQCRKADISILRNLHE